MTCDYCDNPNLGFAGRRGPDTVGLCDQHAIQHRQWARWFSPMAERMRGTAPRPPRWRYYAHRGWWYCWTTERMDDGRFVAFIYQPDGDAMRLVKEVRFAKRMTAKAKALAWQQKAKSSSSGRLPASMLK